MAQNPRSTSILESLGEEIVRIVAPVSICMFMVVILVTVLSSDSSPSSTVMTIANIAFSQTSFDSSWNKFVGALLYSLVFVAFTTIITFLLVLLFYFRYTKFLKIYMGFSAFLVLGFMGGEIALFLIEGYNIPIDCITFLVLLFNFAVVGVLAVFMSKMAIVVTQGYLVIIGMLAAYWFTLLPEWTTWVLLVAMSLYDLAAVLLPVGPLRLLVELAMTRDEEIPALVYEARPVTHHDSTARSGVVQRRLWRERRNESSNADADSNLDSNTVSGESGNSESNANVNVNISHSNPNLGTLDSSHGDTRLLRVEEGQISDGNAELSAPLLDHRTTVPQLGQEDAASSENLMLEGIGLGSSGAIKLGLGDFIFYSVLVGRAAMYDYMTVYACYLAIIAGLGITLMLLSLYQKALPALPVSILLGQGCVFNVELTDEDVSKLIDGTQIQATMFNEAVRKFYERFQLGKVYYISKDVIGFVQSVPPTISIRRKSNNENIPKRDITIADETKKTVVVSLWNDFVTTVGQELLDIADQSPIVAIKALKVGDFQGVSLSTVSRTTVLVNPEIPEAKKYDSEGKAASMAPIGTGVSPSTKTAARSMYSDRVFLSHITENHSLGEDKPVFFSVRAYLSFIKHDQTMWYRACKTCNKKVTEAVGSGCWREGCQKNDEECSLRYILGARVSDASGEDFISAFNNEAESIIGCSADELDKLKAEGGEDNLFHQKLKQATWVPHLFRITVSQNEYNNEKRQRITVREVAPVDFAAESRFARRNIKDEIFLN